jgi:acyl CoA:acetate/3-ketoacid CoA transferase
MMGSDLLKWLKEETAPDNVREMDDPFGGEHLVLVKAMNPDVAVLQVQMSDAEGNCRVLGPTWENAEAARAAKKVVVITEDLVPVDIIRQQPELTLVPGFHVDAVVHLPYGAHPTSLYKYYDHDEEHLKHYVSKARSEKGIAEYIDEYIIQTKDHMDYLDKVGGLRVLSALKANPLLGY